MNLTNKNINCNVIIIKKEEKHTLAGEFGLHHRNESNEDLVPGDLQAGSYCEHLHNLADDGIVPFLLLLHLLLQASSSFALVLSLPLLSVTYVFFQGSNFKLQVF